MKIQFLFSNILEDLQYGSWMLLGVRRGRVGNCGAGRKTDCQDNVSLIFLEQRTHKQLGRAQICKNSACMSSKLLERLVSMEKMVVVAILMALCTM